MKTKHIEGKVMSIDVINKRIDNLIAMRGVGEYDSHFIYDDENGVNIQLYTNGISAVIHVKWNPGNYRALTYEIPEKYIPAVSYGIYKNGSTQITIHTSSAIYVNVAEGDSGDCSDTYPLKSVCIGEIEDMRVGYDGTVYPTAGEAIRSQFTKKEAKAWLSEATLRASAWKGTDNLHSQVVQIAGVTPYSKVDLLPSVEQLAIFYGKDVGFVTENENGVVTAYAIGQKPELDYTMQVQITEVEA